MVFFVEKQMSGGLQLAFGKTVESHGGEGFDDPVVAFRVFRCDLQGADGCFVDQSVLFLFVDVLQELVDVQNVITVISGCHVFQPWQGGTVFCDLSPVEGEQLPDCCFRIGFSGGLAAMMQLVKGFDVHLDGDAWVDPVAMVCGFDQPLVLKPWELGPEPVYFAAGFAAVGDGFLWPDFLTEGRCRECFFSIDQQIGDQCDFITAQVCVGDGLAADLHVDATEEPDADGGCAAFLFDRNIFEKSMKTYTGFQRGVGLGFDGDRKIELFQVKIHKWFYSMYILLFVLILRNTVLSYTGGGLLL